MSATIRMAKRGGLPMEVQIHKKTPKHFKNMFIFTFIIQGMSVVEIEKGVLATGIPKNNFVVVPRIADQIFLSIEPNIANEKLKPFTDKLTFIRI